MLLDGRGKRCCSTIVSHRQRGWEGGGAKVSEGGAGEGCAGRVVKDKGVREGQHLDPELFPMRVTFV